MKKLVRALWLLSLPVFLLVFLVTYSWLPEVVSVGFKASGLAFVRMARDHYYYLSIAILLVTNIICFALVKLFEMMPVNTEGAFSFFYQKELFKERLLSWMYSLMLIINMFFITAVCFIGIFNSSDSTSLFKLGVLLYVWPVMMLVWLGLLVGMLVSKK
ncbi:hypothetical protein QWY31_01170 [Cytophagales bacterium LB-30]|uniref:Uncharacterized protein n=1 Tax=Shiella aurantiaca TaxID=3058365 RepID=A0ABT8F0V8_9BACT|nr:hypothetical protein [Shiella aurantiaca]MDN4164086.1 hypothetical protein [Shiella aurantiaca]